MSLTLYSISTIFTIQYVALNCLLAVSPCSSDRCISCGEFAESRCPLIMFSDFLPIELVFNISLTNVRTFETLFRFKVFFMCPKFRLYTYCRTMCKFSYYHYDGCRHKEVRLDSYCARSLFNAGIDGILTTKCEQKLDGLNTQSQSVLVWDGLTGYCTGCRRLYGVSFILLQVSLGKLEFTNSCIPMHL